MRYQELGIRSHREAPNNARSEGAAWLIRAGYMTRDGKILSLGLRIVENIRIIGLENLGLPILFNKNEVYFPCRSGAIKILRCNECGLVAREALVTLHKFSLPQEEPARIVKVYTPGCETIEALSIFLKIPKKKRRKRSFSRASPIEGLATRHF